MWRRIFFRLFSLFYEKNHSRSDVCYVLYVSVWTFQLSLCPAMEALLSVWDSPNTQRSRVGWRREKINLENGKPSMVSEAVGLDQSSFNGEAVFFLANRFITREKATASWRPTRTARRLSWRMPKSRCFSATRRRWLEPMAPWKHTRMETSSTRPSRLIWSTSFAEVESHHVLYLYCLCLRLPLSLGLHWRGK